MTFSHTSLRLSPSSRGAVCMSPSGNRYIHTVHIYISTQAANSTTYIYSKPLLILCTTLSNNVKVSSHTWRLDCRLANLSPQYEHEVMCQQYALKILIHSTTVSNAADNT